MFRFTIRDVLWLTTLVAMSVVVWINQRTTRAERASVETTKRELAAWRESMDKERVEVERLRKLIELVRPRIPVKQIAESERQRIIQKSAELGAPQPKPLPPGYGEKPNQAATQGASTVEN